MATAYKGRVFSVEVDAVQLPNGRTVEMAIVRHPPSVVLIPIQDDGRIVLIRQYRHSLKQEIWELPAGSLEPGESAEAAAARECEEEIGLVPGRLERLRGLYPTPGYCDEELIFFRATELKPPPPGSPHQRDEDELIVVEAFTIAQAKSMVEQGVIIDMKTVCGLLMS